MPAHGFCNLCSGQSIKRQQGHAVQADLALRVGLARSLRAFTLRYTPPTREPCRACTCGFRSRSAVRYSRDRTAQGSCQSDCHGMCGAHPQLGRHLLQEAHAARVLDALQLHPQPLRQRRHRPRVQRLRGGSTGGDDRDRSQTRRRLKIWGQRLVLAAVAQRPCGDSFCTSPPLSQRPATAWRVAAFAWHQLDAPRPCIANTPAFKLSLTAPVSYSGCTLRALRDR